MRLQIEGSIAVATIARPPVNAFDEQTLQSLVAVLAQLEMRPEVRALLITGSGERFFSAGAELRQFNHGNPVLAHRSMDAFAAAFDSLASFKGVTIAAINGVALGGGLECALACDMRIAEAHAELGLPETLVGLLPGGGGTQRLPRLVGPGWAKRMILLGERVDAMTAERIGLVEATVPRGEALATAQRWASQAARPGPSAARASKRLIDEIGASELVISLQRERSGFADLFGSDEQKEGIAAFLEKRPPSWPNT